MEHFKLIAIRPLHKCATRFSKNLTNGEIYPFYNDYIFENKDNKPVGLKEDVHTITPEHAVPDGFYDTKTADDHHLNVSISAVVGKNGSGKSTLMELLYAALYLFAVNEKILYPDMENIKQRKINIRKNKTADKKAEAKIFKEEKQKAFELLSKFKDCEKDDENYLQEIKKQLLVFARREDILNGIESTAEKDLRNADNDLRKLALFRAQLSVELYYEIKGVFFMLSVDKGESKVAVINKDILTARNLTISEILGQPFDFSRFFFYTISINHSHYGLNSTFVGNWIRHLFHKNDGYVTPIVINPMRTDGDYKINDEIKFAKYRLLSNKLIEAKKQGEGAKIFITDHQYIHKVRFKINNKKIEKGFVGDIARVIDGQQAKEYIILKDFYRILYPNKRLKFLNTANTRFVDQIGNYVFQKVKKISFTYAGFYDGYTALRADPEKNIEFLEKIIAESSHITNKLKQALHFLVHNERASKPFEQSILEAGQHMDFSLDELLDWMGNPDFFEIINHMPPSIFDIEFLLMDESEKSVSSFNDLSSGEQQMIHAIQSVVYHLNNLQSVNYSIVERIKYSCVNVVFDEIELYFHPEYQRKFVDELLKSFEKLYFGDKEGIKSIGIQFLTHSPFILSDIPRNNILKLQKGSKLPLEPAERTFGANIHEQLTHSFFMDSTIGEFAGIKIEKIIEFYYKVRSMRNDDLLEEHRKEYNDKRIEFDFIVKNVGEDIIRGLLENHIGYIEERLMISKKDE